MDPVLAVVFYCQLFYVIGELGVPSGVRDDTLPSRSNTKARRTALDAPLGIVTPIPPEVAATNATLAGRSAHI